MYTVGIDFGTLSGRALLVDTRDGREVASAVFDYPHGVIDESLPTSSKALLPEWALRDPLDYLEAIRRTVPAVLQESGVSSEEVVGLASDFTACTVLPTLGLSAKYTTKLSKVVEDAGNGGTHRVAAEG